MSAFLSRVQAAFQSLLPPQGKIIAGISGGADSMALLHLLAELLPQAVERLQVVHIQHGIRGQAAQRDCRLVAAHCHQLGLPLAIYSSDVARLAGKLGLSLEEAGRLVRHDCFLDAANQVRARAVVLAHHQDDQAETVLLNLMRGAGGQGLSALRPTRPFPHPAAPQRLKLVRPLLAFSKAELKNYLRQKHIAWREDRSNRDQTYTRNRIRIGLLPYLEKNFNPQIRHTLAASSGILAREDDYLDTLARRLWRRIKIKMSPQTAAFNRPMFLKQAPALQYRVLALVWEELNIPRKSMQHLERLCQAVRLGLGVLSLPGKWSARVDADQVVLKIQLAKPPAKGFRLLVLPGKRTNPNSPYGVQIEFLGVPRKLQTEIRSDFCLVDAGQWPKAVYLRFSRPGDYIRTLGMHNQKKLVKKILSEMRIPREKRAEWPVLAKGKEVLWVYQGPISEKLKITGNTKKAYKIRIFSQDVENQPV